MTDIPSQHDATTPSPFQEEILLENYYASESSKQVLLSINQAVADGVRLMVLTGDEGTGKTMLCNKLDKDPQDVFTTVFFPRTVDSFEDVVRIVAMGMGLETVQDEESRTVDTLLYDISKAMVSGGIPLFLIFDEAENIYLATLERIRKMLDRLAGDGGRIHVLFSGRKTFLENCEQLSMCDFDNDEEYQIRLEPLTEEETATYLTYASSKLPEVEGNTIFTPEVITNIFQLSGGNFRMINILAEEALHKNGDDTSFMVLLENVKDQVMVERDNGGFLQLIKEYLQQYRSYIPYGGVLFVILIAGTVFLGGKEEQDIVQPQKIPVLEQAKDPVVIKIEKDTAGDSSGSQPVRIPDVTPQEEPVAQAVQDIISEESVVEKVPEELPEVEIEVAQQTEFSSPVQEEVIDNQPAPEPVEEESTVAETAIEPDPIPEVKEVEVVTLHRVASTKKRPGKLPKTTQVTIREETKKERRGNEVREVIASNAHFTIEQLYKKRLMAGTPWYNNERNDKYTVQLMVLTSEDAEINLKKMLQEDRYRQEAGNFYIFRKLSTADTLFIFYGEYSTIAQARLAQNSLPRFLRDHKPYAISVKGAMAKVRR